VVRVTKDVGNARSEGAKLIAMLDGDLPLKPN